MRLIRCSEAACLMKKIKIPSEIVYLISIVLLSLSVAMLTSVDFGISMIVAPAYLLSLKLGFLTFGQAEYVIQAVLFIILCIVLRRIKAVYLTSFLTCLIYGFVLDLWRLIPFFNPDVTAPGSMNITLRIVLFVVGVVLTSFSIALCFKTYLYPQVYDFSVKAVTARYKIKLSVFKTAFDFSCLAVALIMTFCFFGKLEGIGVGTLIMVAVNGTLIGFFSKMLDKTVECSPIFPKFAAHFSLDDGDAPNN